MAKREQFEIRYNYGDNDNVVIKYKWNSANREVETIIDKIARAEFQRYKLTFESSVGDSKAGHTSGVREWTGQIDDNVIRFTITKK